MACCDLVRAGFAIEDSNKGRIVAFRLENRDQRQCYG